jgi:hypothetical protein
MARSSGHTRLKTLREAASHTILAIGKGLKLLRQRLFSFSAFWYNDRPTRPPEVMLISSVEAPTPNSLMQEMELY